MSVRSLCFAALVLMTLAVRAMATESCFDCHEAHPGDSSTTGLSRLPESVHAGLDCSDCHTAVNFDMHPSDSARHVDCFGCHEDEAHLYTQSVHSRKRDAGNGKAPYCSDCHGSHNIREVADTLSSAYRLHIPLMCAKCHATADTTVLTRSGKGTPYEAYANSIHGKLILRDGNTKAAVCSDCHEPHRQLRRLDPRASIYKTNIPATCGQCHGEIAQAYEASVHGRAVKNDNLDAPVCTDCHSEHRILPPEDEQSKVYGANISRTTCLDCHQTLRLTDAKGFYKEKDYSYRDSYHGAASRAGVVEVANCASCHGVHNILPSSDAQSSINKANLPATCGKCHPNATVNFAAGTVHTREVVRATPAAWVRYVYLWLIVLVLSGMTLHNGILFAHGLRHRGDHVVTTVEYQRFSRHERWQHWILALLFIGLVATGFAFRFSESWWSRWWVGSSGGFQVRDFSHRLFGGLFGALMLYHLAYMWFTHRGRVLLRELWPTLADARGLWQNLRYHLSHGGQPMQVPGLFDYAEKAEYWALVWGSWVMLLTGLPMWFENLALSLMPLWLLDVSRAVHFYEAILASAAIVIWHFYFVIFDPHHYPLNMSMITGRARPRDGFDMKPWMNSPAPKPDLDPEPYPAPETDPEPNLPPDS